MWLWGLEWLYRCTGVLQSTCSILRSAWWAFVTENSNILNQRLCLVTSGLTIITFINEYKEEHFFNVIIATVSMLPYWRTCHQAMGRRLFDVCTNKTFRNLIKTILSSYWYRYNNCIAVIWITWIQTKRHIEILWLSLYHGYAFPLRNQLAVNQLHFFIQWQ